MGLKYLPGSNFLFSLVFEYMHEHILSKLIDDLARFPGIGRKTSQRMAIHLLNKDRKGAEEISASIQEALSKVRKCSRCRALTEFDICSI